MKTFEFGCYCNDVTFDLPCPKRFDRDLNAKRSFQLSYTISVSTTIKRLHALLRVPEQHLTVIKVREPKCTYISYIKYPKGSPVKVIIIHSFVIT
jgi:hypothetical protein